MSTVTELRTRQAIDAQAQREAAKAAHPATVSKQQLPPSAVVAAVAGRLELVERQQALGALVAALGDDRLDLTSTTDLPLIVLSLLVTCPQTISHPATVAKVIDEASSAHRRSVTAELMGCDDDARREADDAAFLTGELVRGQAVTATHEYLMEGCSALRDWLVTAVNR